MRFLLVDRIMELESGKRAAGVKNVTLSEDFFTHHFPFHPIMPGALITECLVQLADWLIRESVDFESIATPASFDSLKFYRLVRPGDQLKLDVEIVSRENEHCEIRGEARCEGERVAVARFTMTLRPAAEFQPPEEARKYFRMIRGE
jgi:3-hydroxymyristoyl/3-hydroxydecanoyl-(acyl carrier protein) dehydratase